MSDRVEITEDETRRLIKAADNRVLALAFGIGHVYIKENAGQAWALRLLCEWRGIGLPPTLAENRS